MSQKQALKDHFESQGYIILDNAFSNNKLEDFRKVLQSVVRLILNRAIKKFPHLKDVSVEDGCDKALLALRYADPEYVSIIQRTISRFPEFYQFCASKKVFNTIRFLLDLPAYSPTYLLSNGVVFTNPNDSKNQLSSNFELDWHKDTFFTIPHSRYVQFWGPLTHDFTEEIGTLRICPGSHKDGYGKQRIHPELEFNRRYSMDPSEITKYKPISINLKLGQLLIFDGQLIHASGFNTSKYVRTTILGLCHDVSKEEFLPVSPDYYFHGKTPEAWFYEIYKDEKAKAIMYDNLVPESGPPGGL